MALISARQYAKDNGLSERTVRGWAERGEVEGVQQVGTMWVAPADAWATVASKQRGRGRPKKEAPET